MGFLPTWLCSNGMFIEPHSLIKLRLIPQAVIVRVHNVTVDVPWTAGQWPSASLSALVSAVPRLPFWARHNSVAGDDYIATLSHVLGLSRASSCGVRWARANAFSSPIITKCLTPYEDIPATAPRAIYCIHWTSQQYRDAGNESAKSTNHARHC